MGRVQTSQSLSKVKNLLLTTATNTAQCQSLLRHYAITKSLKSTKQLHAHIISSGLLSSKDSNYITSLITSTYALCGHIPNARILFDRLPHRTLRSCNTMIKMFTQSGLSYDAVRLFVEMFVSDYPKPSKLTYPFVIKACGDLRWVRLGVLLHGLTVVNGFDSDSFVGNSLLSMYMSCGEKERARRVFDKMCERTAVAWNTMISGYFQNGSAKDALKIFKKMLDEGVEADCATIVSVLPACGHLKDLKTGQVVHSLVEDKHLGCHLPVRNSLMDMYVKCGEIDQARVIFDKMNDRDVVSWTTMINGLVLSDDLENALRLCPAMLSEGVKLNGYTLACVLSACVNSQYLGYGKCLHAWALRHKLGTDVNVETALIDMYAKCKSIKHSFRVFRKTSKSKQVPWNAILSGCIYNNLEREAIELFKEMLLEAVDPNEATLKSILPAYSNLADLQQAMNLHSYLIKLGFFSRIEVVTGLVDIYSKCGSLDYAYIIFDGVPSSEKDIILWSVIVSGYGMHGHGKTAVTLFYQMVESGVIPNEVTFTSVLHACSHAGLVDEGLSLFKFMLKVRQGSLVADHYTCIVDLLGRADRLEEAYELIRTMPFEPNHAVWGALLGACVIHEDVELGEVAAKRLFEIEPENTGNYVLLGKIYAAVGRWKDAEKVREMMNDIGLVKSPALSVVEVRNI